MNLPFLDTARSFYENLNEREKRLVTILGIVTALIAVALPLWFASTAIARVRMRTTRFARCWPRFPVVVIGLRSNRRSEPGRSNGTIVRRRPSAVF